ncbi:MAG: hypothetical protein KFH98_13845 [Gemmatimonadetes bacterium]|nr:hypothetical protein [Gemmatimonadota bacterium]
MIGSMYGAPVRQLARAGALAILVLTAACDNVPGAGPRVLELANDTIRLEAGVEIVEVEVRRSADGEFDPAAVEAHTGDVVRFVAGDNGGHAIVFESMALTADVREYLERTGQLRSPPLITTGASWVVTLEGAPAGDYPFRCSTHSVSGRLNVAAR